MLRISSGKIWTSALLFLLSAFISALSRKRVSVHERCVTFVLSRSGRCIPNKCKKQSPIIRQDRGYCSIIEYFFTIIFGRRATLPFKNKGRNEIVLLSATQCILSVCLNYIDGKFFSLFFCCWQFVILRLKTVDEVKILVSQQSTSPMICPVSRRSIWQKY